MSNTPPVVTVGFSDPDANEDAGSTTMPSIDRSPLPGEGDTADNAQASRATSLLGRIGARRSAKAAELYIDKMVPRRNREPEEPIIYVRFRPIDPDLAADAWERRQKRRKDGQRHPHWRTMASAESLVASTIGVYGLIFDAGEELRLSFREGDPFGPWTKFDPDLAKAIGSQASSAADICRDLYETDGDLLRASAELSEWSGVALPDVDGTFSES